MRVHRRDNANTHTDAKYGMTDAFVCVCVHFLSRCAHQDHLNVSPATINNKQQQCENSEVDVLRSNGCASPSALYSVLCNVVCPVVMPPNTKVLAHTNSLC